MRDNGDEPGRVMRSMSQDNGYEWSVAQDSDIPNPGASIEVITLTDGDWLMVLQAFSWEMLKKEEDRDTTMIRYPSYKESRFMAFNAIVHGATGILYWGSNYTPQPSTCISDLNKVTGELGGMQEILAAPDIELNIKKEYHELRYSVDAGIEILSKKFNDKYYLLTVNSDKNPVKVSLTGLDKYDKVNVLSEDRTVTIEKGELIDLYEPFDVHTYELCQTNSR